MAQLSTGLPQPAAPIPLQPPAAAQSAPQAPPPQPQAPADDPLAPVMAKIAGGESGGSPDPYTARYGFPQQPGAAGPAGISHAAGKYQFEPGTWVQTSREMVAQGQPAPNFANPADQERVARFLAQKTYKQNTGRDLASDAAAGKVDYPALSGQWPSLKQTAGRDLVERVRQGKFAEAADLDKAAQAAIKQIGTLGGSISESMKRVRDAQDKAEKAQQTVMEAIAKPPQHPEQDAIQHMGGLATVVGILGGLFTRSPMRASINAAASATEAYNQGDIDKYKLAYSDWKTHTDLLFKIADESSSRARDILYDEKMGNDERRAMLDTTLRAAGLSQLADAARTQGEGVVLDWTEKMGAAQQAKELRMAQIDNTNAYREATLALRSGSGTGALLDKPTLNQMADQYLAGDKSVLTGLGYGNLGAQNRAALRVTIQEHAKDAGMNGRDIATALAEYSGLTAGERSLGTRTAQMGMAVDEARKLIPQVLETSEKVDRSEYPTLNKLLIAAEKGTGGENVVQLGIAINSFINVYARAISPTGVPTVSDKDHARELLEPFWSNGQIRAGMEQITKELQAAAQAPRDVTQEFRERGATQVSQPQIGTIGTQQPASGGVPAGVPEGSQKVGTKDGNPVFRGPDGSLYMVH